MDAMETYNSNSEGEEGDVTKDSKEDCKPSKKKQIDTAIDLSRDSEEESMDSSSDDSGPPKVPYRNPGSRARRSTKRRVVDYSTDGSLCDLELKQMETKLNNTPPSNKRKVQSPNESESSMQTGLIVKSKQKKQKTVKSTEVTSSVPVKTIGRPRKFTELSPGMTEKLIVKLKNNNQKAVEQIVEMGISIPTRSLIMDFEKVVQDVGMRINYESHDDDEGLDDTVKQKSLKNVKARLGLSQMVLASIGVIDILAICDMDLFSSSFGIGINKHICNGG